MIYPFIPVIRCAKHLTQEAQKVEKTSLASLAFKSNLDNLASLGCD